MKKQKEAIRDSERNVPNKQSRVESAIESTLNIATGFLVSLVVWIWLVPLLWPQLDTPVSTDIGLTVLFTISSWLRSYGWRRFFANDVHKIVHQWVRNVWGKEDEDASRGN